MSRHISELARGMAEKKKYGDVEFNEQQMEEFRLVAKKTHFLTFFARFSMIVACLCFGKHYLGILCKAAVIIDSIQLQCMQLCT